MGKKAKRRERRDKAKEEQKKQQEKESREEPNERHKRQNMTTSAKDFGKEMLRLTKNVGKLGIAAVQVTNHVIEYKELYIVGGTVVYGAKLYYGV